MARHHLARGALALWAAACLGVGALLMAQHVIALPRPPAKKVAPLTHGGTLSVTHVLSAGCGCSQRVLSHLLARGAHPDVHERILFVGSDADVEARARGAGYSFSSLTAEALQARYGIESSPLLIIVDGEARVRYLGGYTAIQRGPDIRDLALVDAVERGETPAPLPVFGCAVSRSLQRKLDPLGLKY